MSGEYTAKMSPEIFKWPEEGGNALSGSWYLPATKRNVTSQKTHSLNLYRCNNLKYHAFIHILFNYAIGS
jgi:hypothetical protein